MRNAGVERQGGWAPAVAGLIALVAWTGIGVHFHALADGLATWPAVLWTLLGYFTITTNLLVAVVFTGIATRVGLGSPWLLGGTLLNIVLVGVVYGFLLQGLRELTAGSQLANILLHRATPVLVSVFWLAFVKKGTLTWRAPLLWALYPLGYLLYALGRGAIEARYPYPFINVVEIGWLQTLLNSALLAFGFVIVGEGLVWLDRWLAAARRA